MMRRLGVAVAVSVLMAAGCGDNTDSGDHEDVDAGTEAGEGPAPHRPEPGSRYVALGSSYAAGLGIPETESMPCGRSSANYPQLVAAEFDLDLTDVSCSGAVIDDIVSQTQDTTPGPQLDAVTPDTALITVTIGGNDVDYIGTAIRCSVDTVLGTPCTELDDLNLDDGRFPALVTELQDMLGDLRAAAPNGQIVFVGYPQVIVEDPEPCPDSMPMAADDLAVLGDVGARLQAAHVEATADPDVVFIDAYSASEGHDACAAEDERWVHGAEASPQAEGLYHPTAAAMRAEADLIIAALDR